MVLFRIGHFKGGGNFFVRAGNSGRVGNTSMSQNRHARPNRTGFARGIVTDGDDNMHHPCLWSGKFIPALRPRKAGLNSMSLQHPQRKGIWFSRWQ